jgi:hypothetical protein
MSEVNASPRLRLYLIRHGEVELAAIDLRRACHTADVRLPRIAHFRSRANSALAASGEWREL